VLWRSLHHVEYECNVIFGYLGVKQIGHAVDEDQSRPPPMKGNVQGVWTQREVEAVGERPREPQSDSFGIAAVTTGRDFRATTRRVPRRLRPFNRGVIGRHAPENTRVGSKKVLCAHPTKNLPQHSAHSMSLTVALVWRYPASIRPLRAHPPADFVRSSLQSHESDAKVIARQPGSRHRT
jgi:hypothetical protein